MSHDIKDTTGPLTEKAQTIMGLGTTIRLDEMIDEFIPLVAPVVEGVSV
jgi:hypothetical protein